MSGYKRVNFYELCRLCATNQQKEKTHIFQEEGRKIQLQNKIQSCLSLKVCENDFLPKVVCSKCLRTLEECCIFRKECYTSETMLSSYFNNFRYTEDFKKSGKVYIKDTSPKVITTQASTDMCVQTPANTLSGTSNASYSINVVPNTNGSVTQEPMSYYTLHLPATPQTQETKAIKDPKVLAQPQIVYNLNTIKTVIPNVAKTNLSEAVGNVTVNSNGEVITIAPLVDVDAFLSQNVIQKPQRRSHRKHKIMDAKGADETGIVKIDLTQEVDCKQETVEKMKYPNKVAYTIKIDEAAKGPVLLNPLESASFNRMNNFSTNQAIISSTSNTNLSRMPKTYQNFHNSNLTASVPTSKGISIATGISVMNPVPDVANLNPDASQIASAVNLPASGFNHATSMNYSIANTKQESIHVDCDVSIPSDQVALAHIFSTSNASITTNPNQTTCSSLRTSSTSIGSLNTVPVQNVSFPVLSAAPTFSTATAMSATLGSSPVEPLPKSEGAKRHSCDVCCKTFKRREHLYQHVKLHTGFRPFKCEHCSKSFMRKEHLLRHMTSHSGQKNYTCSICDKSFSRNDNLLKHKKIHNKQSSFTCEVCQKQFVMEHYYLTHKHTHESEKCSVNQMWGLLKAV